VADVVRVLALVQGGEEPGRFHCEFEVVAELDSGERVSEGVRASASFGGFPKWTPSREEVERFERRGFPMSEEALPAVPFVVELDGGWLTPTPE
jgi:hypothetical protein